MGRVFYDKLKVLNAAKRLGCTEGQYHQIESLDTYSDERNRQMVLRSNVHSILEQTFDPYVIRLLESEEIAYYRPDDAMTLKTS